MPDSTPVDLERKNSICSEGVHTFKIVKSEEKMGPSGPYWNFQMNCIDEGPDKGQAVWSIVSLAPQARFKLDQFLDAVGAPEKGTVTHENFVGKTLRVKIVWETYNDTTKARADVFIPVGGPAPKSQPAKAQSSDAKLPSDATTDGFKPPF